MAFDASQEVTSSLMRSKAIRPRRRIFLHLGSVRDLLGQILLGLVDFHMPSASEWIRSFLQIARRQGFPSAILAQTPRGVLSRMSRSTGDGAPMGDRRSTVSRREEPARKRLSTLSMQSFNGDAGHAMPPFT